MHDLWELRRIPRSRPGDIDPPENVLGPANRVVPESVVGFVAHIHETGDQRRRRHRTGMLTASGATSTRVAVPEG